MKIISIGLRVMLSLIFVGAGGAKLAGIPMMVEEFEAVGFGQWFRYFTGLVEISGVVLLWWPDRQAFGASLLGATMVGAVLTHWFIIGPSAAPAIVLGVICALVLFLYRDQITPLIVRGRPT